MHGIMVELYPIEYRGWFQIQTNPCLVDSDAALVQATPTHLPNTHMSCITSDLVLMSFLAPFSLSVSLSLDPR